MPETLPDKGLPRDEVLQALRRFGEHDADWREARTWSLVYHLGDEHSALLREAYGAYFSENALNPMAFASLRRMESEVVRMTAALLHGGDSAVGTLTSGGTESCLLAIKTYRDRARARRPWIRRPEAVVPESVHVAFDKAGEYFGVRIVHAPLGPDCRVDVEAVKKLVNRNTVVVVGSAPCYPFGVVDPIAELGRVAQRAGVPLHVDSCLGGYLLPFLEQIGHPVPAFDFRVPGVCSISADVHKYGYAAKGASVILYRDKELLKHQLFVFEDWPGGVFASPALLGTRPGGAIAAAWASLVSLGADGYRNHAATILRTTKRLVDGVAAIPELQIVAPPDMSVFAYKSRSPKVSIYAVGDQLEARGWHVDRQQRPESLHAMVTPRHEAVVDRYLADVREAVETVKAHPELAEKGGAATYGMISKIPLRGVVRDNVIRMMLDAYSPGGSSIDPAAGAKGRDFATRAGLFLLEVHNRLQRGDDEGDRPAARAARVLRPLRRFVARG